METGAVESLHLNEKERELLGELLEGERQKLAVEVRHTDKRLFREGLKHRLDEVEALLSRLKRS